jgi:hypothetical protein
MQIWAVYKAPIAFAILALLLHLHPVLILLLVPATQRESTFADHVECG